jgi:hypothetical protein
MAAHAATAPARAGVGLQTFRDWVLRFNAAGPTGLVDGKARGQAPRLPHAATACLLQRNSELSTHMRCRMTASLRATATRARAMPRRFATCMPQARSEHHFVLRVSSEWAAS